MQTFVEGVELILKRIMAMSLISYVESFGKNTGETKQEKKTGDEKDNSTSDMSMILIEKRSTILT